MDLDLNSFIYIISEKLSNEIKAFLSNKEEDLDSIVINIEDLQRLGKSTFIYTILLPFLFDYDNYYLNLLLYSSVKFLSSMNIYLTETPKMDYVSLKKELYTNIMDYLNKKDNIVFVNINGMDLFNFFVNAYKTNQNKITKYHISIAMFVATLRVIISEIRSKFNLNYEIKKIENKIIEIAKKFHIVSNVFCLGNEKSVNLKNYISFRNRNEEKYELNPLFFISDVMVELLNVWHKLIDFLKSKRVLLIIVFEDLERFTLKPEKENDQEFLEIVGNYLMITKRYLLDLKTKNIISIFEIPKEYSDYLSPKCHNIFNKIENSFPRNTLSVSLNMFFIQVFRDCITFLNYLELYYYFEKNDSFENYIYQKYKEKLINLKEEIKNIVFLNNDYLKFIKSSKNINFLPEDDKYEKLPSNFPNYIYKLRWIGKDQDKIKDSEIILYYNNIFSENSLFLDCIYKFPQSEKFKSFDNCLNDVHFLFETFRPKIPVYFLNNKKTKLVSLFNKSIVKKYKFIILSYILVSVDFYITQLILEYFYENTDSVKLIKSLLKNKIYEQNPILFILSSYIFLVNKQHKLMYYEIEIDHFFGFLENIKSKKKNLVIKINSNFSSPNIVFELNDNIISFVMLENLLLIITENFRMVFDKSFSEEQSSEIKELLLSIKDLPEFMKNKINSLKELKYSELLCILAYIGFVKYTKHQNDDNKVIKSFYYYLDENKLEDITIKELKETIKKLKSIETKEELINYLKKNKKYNKALLKEISYLLLSLVNS